MIYFDTNSVNFYTFVNLQLKLIFNDIMKYIAQKINKVTINLHLQ